MRESKYTRELLAPIVARARSVSQVLHELGLRPTGGNYRMVATRVRFLGIATGHLRGQAWARGGSADDDKGIARNMVRRRRSDAEVFIVNSPETNGWRLVRRLARLGWIWECAVCKLSEWRGQRLRLELDHINGVNNDNRFENLRLLCPNCHSQTDTYCRRKAGPVVERQTR